MTNTEKEKVVWKTYPDYPFVQANQFGEVRTTDRYVTRKDGSKQFVKGRVLKRQLNKRTGYLQVCISVNGKPLTLKVHRIVAACFLPNPDNLPQVNHKDCDRTNNNVNNLEWCTNEYNVAYREKYGKAQSRPVFAVDLRTLKVLYFKSQGEAARQLGVTQGDISAILKGHFKTIHGFWFTEDESEITEEKVQKLKNSITFLNGVIAVNLKTFEVLYFKTQYEAKRQLNVYAQNINHVLKGQRKTAGGFWFCYADEHAIEKARVKFGNEVASKVECLMSDKS